MNVLITFKLGHVSGVNELILFVQIFDWQFMYSIRVEKVEMVKRV